MRQHTATPWNVVNESNGTFIDSKIGRIASLESGYQTMRDANAAHIVKCVNSFDDLVNALQRSIKRTEQLCGICNTLSNQLDLGNKVYAEDFTAIARYALAKVGALNVQDELISALEDAEFLLRKAGQIAGPMQDSFNRSAEDARIALAKSRA